MTGGGVGEKAAPSDALAAAARLCQPEDRPAVAGEENLFPDYSLVSFVSTSADISVGFLRFPDVTARRTLLWTG